MYLFSPNKIHASLLAYLLLISLALGSATAVQGAEVVLSNDQLQLVIALPLANNYAPGRRPGLDQFFLAGGKIDFIDPELDETAAQKKTDACYKWIQKQLCTKLITQREKPLIRGVEDIYHYIQWFELIYREEYNAENIIKLTEHCYPYTITAFPLAQSILVDSLNPSLQKTFSNGRASCATLNKAISLHNDRLSLDQLNLFFTANTSLDLLVLAMINHPYIPLFLNLKTISSLLPISISIGLNYPEQIKPNKYKLVKKSILSTLQYIFCGACYQWKVNHPLLFLATFTLSNFPLLLCEEVIRKREDHQWLAYKSKKVADVKRWQESYKHFKREKKLITFALMEYEVGVQKIPLTIVNTIMAFTYNPTTSSPRFSAILAQKRARPKVSPVVVNAILCGTIYSLCSLYLLFTL